ncbi:MAG: PAS domain S-box protein [Actinomycetota bacterium]
MSQPPPKGSTERTMVHHVSPETLRSFLESAPDAVVIIDAAGHIVLVNRQTERLFEYDREVLVGSPIEMLLPERFRDAHVTHRAGYLADPRTRLMGAGLELYGRKSDGREFPVDISLSPLTTEAEVLLAAAIRDTTERHRAEAERLALAAIVESSDDAILAKSLDGIITTWNRAAQRLYGYAAAEVVGRSISLLIPDERAGEEKDILERIGRGEDVDHYETERITKSGAPINVAVTISPVRDPSGTVVGASVIGRDITARVRAEAAVREREQRFRAFLEFAPDAIVIIDPDGEIVLVNAQTEKLFGYERDELVGKSVEELLPERYRAVHVGHRSDYLRDPRSRPMGEGLALSGLRRDGSEFSVDISLGALKTDEGLLLVAAIRDITERRRLEDLRDEFIENAAHELRTPLATLAGLGQVLAIHLKEMTDEQIEESLAALKRQGERASTLVANLLDLSQVESGRATLRLEGVDLATTIRGALGSAPAPEGRTVSVLVAEGLRVRADPVRLEQVVTNLLVNAYRYGGPHIEVHAHEVHPYIEFWVEDDGAGVSPDLVPRLFEPFTRGKNARAISGSGIGLALVRRLVEAFGGVMWHEPVDPHGARFLARLNGA